MTKGIPMRVSTGRSFGPLIALLLLAALLTTAGGAADASSAGTTDSDSPRAVSATPASSADEDQKSSSGPGDRRDAKLSAGVRDAVAGATGDTAVIVALQLADASVANASNGPELQQLRSAVTTASDNLLAALPANGVEVRRTLQYVPAVAVSVADEAALDALLALDEVAHIGLDDGAELHLDDSVPLIGADQRHSAGNDGDGITVIVMDSGVDNDHPDLIDDVQSTQACFGDDDGSINGSGFCLNGSDRQFGPGAGDDDQGHGTHVAGIVSSNGTQADVGVAPGAEIVSIKAFSSAGTAEFRSEFLAAWDWIIANQSTLNANVLNMSFGGSPNYTGSCDADNPGSASAMTTLRSLGILPVASAGNDGTSVMGHPACLSGTVAVGASTDFDSAASFTDTSTITDVFAPGDFILSSNLGGGTTFKSGTSMAAPHAAGCAALLVDSGEATTAAAMEARLEQSTELIQRYGQIFPRIDCGPTTTAICPPDDSLEDNDTLATATTMGTTQKFPAVACDNDYYAFDVFAGDTIDVDIFFTHAQGNLQLQLYGPGGGVVASSTSSNNNESISYTATTGGTYTARIYGASGATNKYRFELSAAGTYCPPDDGYENNDTQAAATPVAMGDSLQAAACSNDDDWFELPLDIYQTVAVDVLFSHSVGDIDVEIYDANGDFLFDSTSASDNEQIVFTSLGDDVFYIRVYGWEGAQNRYQMNLVPDANRCLDPYEKNDNSGDAAGITVGDAISAIGCDDDWYSFTVPAGATITADLYFTDSLADLDLELRAPNGSLLDSSTSSTDNEQVSASAPTTGVYTLLVEFPFFGSITPYDLHLNTTGGPARCNGLPVTVNIGAGQTPTGGNDVILGTSGPDNINAGNGNDVVCAGGGDDTVVGGDGNDVIFGQGGNDLLSGNSGGDALHGGAGQDRAYGGSGRDLIHGGPGNDQALGGSSGADTIFGGSGGDTITGGSDGDVFVSGGAGNDAVNGGGGGDINVGGDAGNDTVSGNGGKDLVHGGEGDDEVRGGQADDLVYGGDGDDFLAGNDGVDYCDGGLDSDTAASNCETTANVP
jgi:subtilisin family serine protease